MNFSFRAATIFFSLLLHGSIVAAGFFLAGNGPPPAEKVYRVSLAEFAPAAPGAPVQETAPQPEPSAPAEPAPEPALPPASPPPPQPAPPPAPEPVRIPQKTRPQPRAERSRPKPVENRQRQTPPASAHPPRTSAQTNARQPAASPGAATGVAGGVPRMIGGMSAYTEDAVDQRPSISRRAMPEYPETARRRHVQGEVVVRVIVDVSGRPRQCAIHSSTPEGIFDNAALAAVRKTLFSPGKVKGQPVNTVVLIPYRFALR